jgi:glycosyltransferase involved in cell wall biosynthesis
VAPAEREVLDRKLEGLAIADRVVFTGFVPDEVLVPLYQVADLFVFPSLYEGFGLPVAEAIACGTPVAFSRIPVLAELLDEPAAQFDPGDPHSIAEVLGRCLSDKDLRARLRAAKLPRSATWPSVAERTVEAYEAVAAVGRRPGRRRRTARIAFVTPLPPQRSGVADDSYRLIAALANHVQIDAFADGETQKGRAPAGIRVLGASNFHPAEAIVGEYAQVFYCLGNSEYHAGALELLRQRSGVVIAHDVRLSGLYGWIAACRPDLLPDGFAAALQDMYGERLPQRLGSPYGIDFWEANRHGILMAREAISLSEAFLVHSTHAAQLARLDASSGDDYKVEVIPFRFPSPDDLMPAENEDTPGALIVGTFGFVSPVKQTDRLVEAWPHVVEEIPRAELAIVGSDGGSGEAARLSDLADALGISDHVFQTGDVDQPTLHRWIARSALAVQLRAGSNGETSASVAWCLASGTPTLVTAIGSARELPRDAVVKVDQGVTPRRLADTIIELLRDASRRASLSRAGKAVARQNSYERAASLLYKRYVERHRRVG